MKRTLFSVFAGLALAVAASVADVVAYGYRAVVCAWDYTAQTMARVFIGPQPMERTAEVKPRLQLVAANSHIERIAKRERPRITAAWRMCPSI